MCETLRFSLVCFHIKEKIIDYLVGEIGQKLSVPAKGYIRCTTIRVPMDPEVFADLFSSLSWGRRRFDVTVGDLDNLLPDGWSERAFRTTTRCVVSREQPIPSSLLTGESCTTIIPSVLAVSGRELARNLLFAKQGRSGRSIWATYLWLLAVRGPIKSKRRMVSWQILLRLRCISVLLRCSEFTVVIEQLSSPRWFSQQDLGLCYRWSSHSLIIVSNYCFCLILRENRPCLDKLKFRWRIDGVQEVHRQ